MNIKQFREAFKLAKNFDIDLSSEDFDHLYGCGLSEFKPVSTTIKSVARLIRWQALCLDSSWDMEEVERLRRCINSAQELALIT